MVGPRHRYLVGALGGMALVGGSVGGLHLIPGGSGTEPASVSGSLPRTCQVHGSATSCLETAAPSAAERSGTNDGSYRDGVYSVTGHYLTPGGSETLGVTLTLTADEVTAAEVEVEATSPTARQFQRQFASRYADQVVAKEVGGLALSRVAGASLTSVGFNEAVVRVQTAARV